MAAVTAAVDRRRKSRRLSLLISISSFFPAESVKEVKEVKEADFR